MRGVSQIHRWVKTNRNLHLGASQDSRDINSPLKNWWRLEYDLAYYELVVFCFNEKIPYNYVTAIKNKLENDNMVNPIRKSAIQGLREGDSFNYNRIFTQEDTLLFGDMTRDYNPVHYDSRWANMKGFRSLICHGLLVGSMICEFGGQVGWLATSMNFKFIKPVYFEDNIHCTVTITKIDENGRAEAEAFFKNQNGEQVCHAHLKGRLPLSQERKLLKQMLKEGDTTNKLSNEKYNR